MNETRDFSVTKGMRASDLVEQMGAAGFQATEVARAARLITRMKQEKATIFLAFTANMVASGLRGIFAEMARRKFVDVIITTGGSIDHDIILSEKRYGLGDFRLDDKALHRKGVNRLGNVLIRNDRYVLLEKRIQKLFAEIHAKRSVWTPSELIHEIGTRIPDKGSFLHWCSRNGIPVFCPGITDSAIGLQLYFYKQDHPDFSIDVSGDMKLADIVINAGKTGGIILGGGISKHHTLGVNILREGLDYAVYVTTAVPYDGSLSGAPPREATSWSKIKEEGSAVSVFCDASIAFPLIMAHVFDSAGAKQ